MIRLVRRLCHPAWLILAALVLGPTPAGSEDGTDEVPSPVEVRCVDDASTARSEVERAFAELQQIHRHRVPGPSGARLLERRVNELLDRLVGFDQFVDLVLGDAWDKAEADQKRDWRAILKQTLRRRYLKKLGSPLTARLEIKGVQLRCDKAKVGLVISDRDGGNPRDVELQLLATFEGETPRTLWLAYDVAVDEVSLLETWRSRFRRIYADGGVAAIDHHMRGLRERYGARPN